MDTENAPTVWHVGRHGEVPGGMSQVINNYLDGAFARVKVKAIMSRDGSRGINALWLWLSALKSIYKLDKRDHNVMVFHLSQGGSFVREGLLLLYANHKGLATVAHLHGSRFVDFSQRYTRLVKLVLGAADIVIVLSEKMSAAIRLVLPSANVVLIPNAVPYGNPRTKENIVVFGGAVGRRKGIDVLIAAWQSIKTDGWRLLIAGPITEPQIVSTYPKNVEMLGAVSHSDLMSLLDRSAIAVLPSRDEAMPMFILEAMARYNCIISTKVGGIPSVLSNGRGILVEPGSVTQLAHALENAMNDKELRARIAASARTAFDNMYSSQAIYPLVEQAWLDALAVNNGQRQFDNE